MNTAFPRDGTSSGALLRALTHNTLPILASNTLGILLGFSELYYASRLGHSALAVVSVAAPWTALTLAWSLVAYSTAVTREVAIEQQTLQNTGLWKTATRGGLVLGTLLGAVCIPASAPLLASAGLVGAELEQGRGFLRIYALALPWLFALGGVQGYLCGVGRAGSAAVFMISAVLLDIALAPLLAFDVGAGLGVNGIAWATPLAAGSVFLAALVWRARLARQTLDSAKLAWAFFGRILDITAPSMLVWLSAALTTWILQVIVSTYGEHFVVAFSLVMKLEQLLVTAASAYAAGVVYIASRASAQHGIALGLRAIKLQQLALAIWIIPMALVAMSLPHAWAALFTREPETLHIATMHTRFFALDLPFLTATQIVGAGFVALGRPAWSFGVMAFKSFGLLVPLTALIVWVVRPAHVEILFASHALAGCVTWLVSETLLKRSAASREAALLAGEPSLQVDA